MNRTDFRIIPSRSTDSGLHSAPNSPASLINAPISNTLYEPDSSKNGIESIVRDQIEKFSTCKGEAG